ncbi:type I-B CRISPR-associated protein Cas5b [Bacteroides bouchesdurhonensis]|uniref:type I-B CRISPR-associated protein Cas5b n=1 Tax=Bacteroides bouchesdurhonensis TaxID=1841855 RepID=UPI0011DD3799|nr:type I-B CRISPR-associated protein Cas5b [Bacteroides bouchesdurhonensis]
MRVYRITISSWTSSFRYPNIISGFQPTLLVPPISTVLGILNACAGKYINHHQLTLGYYFDFEAKSVDLETIYQIETDDRNVPKNLVKSNIMRREFLFNNRLFVYFTDSKWADLFKTPYYPILLGRSSDLATIDNIEAIELPEIANASKVKGQIIPVIGNYLPGIIQALPNYFTDTIPRNNIGTEAYSIIPYDAADIPTRLTAYRDIIDDTEIDIYFHQLDLEQKE